MSKSIKDELIAAFDALAKKFPADVGVSAEPVFSVKLTPRFAFLFLIESAFDSDMRMFMASPQGMEMTSRMSRDLFSRRDVPEMFGGIYGEQPANRRADASLGLFLFASDTSMPAEAQPNASFALRAFQQCLAEMKPSVAFDFVARRIGLLKSIPVLAGMASGIATRAEFRMKSPARRELLVKVRKDLGICKF